MKLSILAGATSQSINVFIQDATSTTGAGLSGLLFNTAGLTANYSFAGANAASTSISLVTLATLATAYSSGGFKEIDSSLMKGWYRLDLPNAAIATSKGRSVALHLQGAASMAPCPVEIELTGWDNQDGVHGGMTALPNTACTTNASLLTSGAGTDQVSVSSGKVLLQATQTGVTIPTVTTVTGQLTAAQIATGIWQDATAGDFTVASSIGKSLYTTGAVPGAAGGLFIAGTNAATTVTTSFTTTFTGNLTGSVGSVTGAVGSVTGAVGSVTGAVGSISGVTFPSGFSTLTTAAIATATWTDTTAGDFTTATSPGKIIFTQLGGAFTTTSSSVFSSTALANAPSGTGASAATIATAVWQDLTASADFSTVGSIGKLLASFTAPLTSAQIATAVWQDATAGDFTVASSIGKSLYTTGAAPGAAGGLFIAGSNAATTVNFTGNVSGSVGSVTAAVTVGTNNDKTGYSLAVAPPTAAAVATAIWQDLTASSDFSTAGSIGLLLKTNVDAATSSRSTYAGGAVASVTGAVGSVTSAVTVNLGQTLNAARALDAIADTSLTVNDALHCAISGTVGKESVTGLTYLVKTPSTGTTLRTFTLDSSSSPTSRT
jgi:hypothetical protein